MWLINTTTLELESFTFPHVPKYAILSHTWGDSEVSFQQFKAKAMTESNFSKVKKTCELAHESGIEYAWMDTCCIDKSSSAELSESINSMYSWYRRAEVCYAFLSDWPPEYDWVDLKPLEDSDSEIDDSTDDNSSGGTSESSDQAQSLDNRPDSANRPNSACSNSDSDTLVRPLRWFTRGWTLQELIAPKKMKFYDSAWNFRGPKSDLVILTHLSRITGITRDVLEDDTDFSLRRICLGQRMSWAARRRTSRIEDIAYCLLGLFEVNMPMLYGEGDNAFLRLQEEIIKSSTDLSIFAWSQHRHDSREYRGILSCHPREFGGLGNCRLVSSQLSQVEEIAMTNKGLRLHTSLFYQYIEGTLYNKVNSHHLYLGCASSGYPQAISLLKMNDTIYVRGDPKKLEIVTDLRRDEARTIYIARNWDNYANESRAIHLRNGIRMRFIISVPYNFVIVEGWPPGLYDRRSWSFLTRELSRFFGYVKVDIFNTLFLGQARGPDDNFLLVCCGDIESGVSVCVLEGGEATSLIEYTKSIWSMVPTEAEDALLAYFRTLVEQPRQEITIKDSLTGALLHISATADACRWPEPSEPSEIEQDGIRIVLKVGQVLPDRYQWTTKKWTSFNS